MMAALRGGPKTPAHGAHPPEEDPLPAKVKDPSVNTPAGS
jgi:hypothetical protein